MLNIYFPELKSEDERIREAIIDEFKGEFDAICDRITPEYDETDEADKRRMQSLREYLVWLEKQGEQKVEPTNITEQLKEEYQKGWDAAMQQLPQEVDSQVWQIANNSGITWEQSFAILMAAKNAYEKGKKDALKEQNPTWSEEDEKKVNNLYVLLDQMVSFNMLSNKDATEFKDWLKSLKGRVQPQPKQEWSKEDVKMIQDIINDIAITQEQVYCKSRCEDEINWLKSLRPQSTWKPSDEQMEALEHFVRSIGESGYASPYDNNTKLLYSLLEQLKKLKE